MAEPADLDVPWTRARAASRLRELLVCGVLGPPMDLYTRRRVTGHGCLDHLSGPVVFVANHDKRRKALSASLGLARKPTSTAPSATAAALLVFAEGTRSRDGRVGRLRSGAALLAAEHNLPIVPIYVSGTREARPRGHRWMVFKAGRPGPRHPLAIRFGKRIAPRAGGRPNEVMEQVRLFLTERGAETEREPHDEHAHLRPPA